MVQSLSNIYLLLLIPSKYSVLQIMGYLKGKTEIQTFIDRKGYYVSIVGLNNATIQIESKKRRPDYGQT